MTNQVWPLRQEQRLSTRIIEGQHWGKRNVAVDAGDAENLPSSECPVVIESQLIISVGDEVVANVEFRAPSASLAIENVLRRGRFIHGVYRKIRGSIIYGSWQWISSGRPCGLRSTRLARMRIELDHLFVCTAPSAPEADKLVQFGLREGPPNQHPGQGTACRRFAFSNAMIELFWVGDESEARGESTRRTQLWERWSGRKRNASPFGICLRPVDSQDTGPPFPAWQYRPGYLPDPLVMYVGEVGIEEPMWFYLSFMRRAQREQWFVEHPIGIREITGLTLTSPVPLRSPAAQRIVESGVLSARTGATSLLEIEFDSKRRKEHVDFRPHLPFVFQL